MVSHVLTSGGSAYTAVTPNQLVDTRVTGTPFNNGQVRSLAIAGKAGAPADATAVVLSATGRGAGSRGLLSVFP